MTRPSFLLEKKIRSRKLRGSPGSLHSRKKNTRSTLRVGSRRYLYADKPLVVVGRPRPQRTEDEEPFPDGVSAFCGGDHEARIFVEEVEDILQVSVLLVNVASGVFECFDGHGHAVGLGLQGPRPRHHRMPQRKRGAAERTPRCHAKGCAVVELLQAPLVQCTAAYRAAPRDLCAVEAYSTGRHFIYEFHISLFFFMLCFQ